MKDKLQALAKKISGVSYVDNGADPTSALNVSRKKVLQKKAESMFTPKPTSSGVGVGM